MRKQCLFRLTLGLGILTSAGAAQQWATRTEAEIQAEIKATQVSAAVERPSIVAGEPLVLKVTVGNESAKDEYACVDRACLAWTVRSPSGVAASAWQAPHTGQSFLPMVVLAPHASASFRLAAADTVGLAPGSYEIAVRYAGGAWGSEPGKEAEARAFIVLPRDEAALAKRVQELREEAASQASVQGRELALQALAAIRYPVAESALCDAIGRSVLAAQYLVPRLEESSDAEAVGCLIDQLAGRRKGDHWIMGALGRMARTQADPVLRQKMENAIADACALVAPDDPFMKGACRKP